MMMKSCIRGRPVLYDEIALIDEEIGSMETNIPSIDYPDDLHGKQADLHGKQDNFAIYGNDDTVLLHS